MMNNRYSESVSKSLGSGNQIQKHKTTLQTRSQAIKQLR